MKNKSLENSSISKLLIFAAVLLVLQTAQVSAQSDNLPNKCVGTQYEGEHSFHYYLMKEIGQCQQSYYVFVKSARDTVIGSQPLVEGQRDDVLFWMVDFNNKPANQGRLEKGLSSSEADNYLKLLLTQPEELRTKAITNAYFDALGRAPTKIEIFAYDKLMQDQKSWYSHALANEIITMNKLPNVRRQMIEQAYFDSMGKRATSDEIGHWKPRSEHYKLLLAANRQFLYSDAGNKYFEGMILMLFIDKYHKNLSPERLQKMKADCRKHRWTYKEVEKLNYLK